MARGEAYTRTVDAFNTATESENRIHDDATASKFGFTGGLVPGVDVFAYMAHGPAKMWGHDWLGGGSMRARFLKPVYDGQPADLLAEETRTGEMALTLFAHGATCAQGEARLRPEPADMVIQPAALRPDPTKRQPAAPETLWVGKVLGYFAEDYTRDLGREHLADVREDASLYEDGRIASPAYLLRRANYILADNVLLGPWIHSESDIRLHGLLRDGQQLETRARVQDNFERKGHLIVALDFACLADGAPVMTGRHWAIYAPRQVREG